jgi:mannose-1-phosphate guanylyltransferase
MRAVVLVGGFGTRLRPLTTSTPKQVLPIVNRPMIERVLEHLGHHGVEEAVLSLGYRPDVFTDAYPDGRCGGVALHYAVEPEPLDTAGAIRFAASDAGITSRFLVVNGDVLTDLDVSALVGSHARSGAEATIALHRVDDPSAYGVVATDRGGRVTAFVEKPPPGNAPSELVNAGTYVFEPAVLERIPQGARVNLERVTFPEMVRAGVLHACDGDTYWIDAGTPETYLQAQLDLIDGTRGTADTEQAVHPSARIDGAVERSVLGPGCVVSTGARVERSVVLATATIGAGAVVHGSVVGPGAVIGEGAVVRGGSVLGDGVIVSPGEAVDGERIPAAA